MAVKQSRIIPATRRQFLKSSTAAAAAAGLGGFTPFAAIPALAGGFAPGMTGGPTGFDGAERFQYNNGMSEGRAIEGIKALKAAGNTPEKLTMLLTDGAIGQITKPFPDGAPSVKDVWEKETGIEIDGQSAVHSPWASCFFEAGFRQDYKGLVLERSEALARTGGVE